MYSEKSNRNRKTKKLPIILLQYELMLNWSTCYKQTCNSSLEIEI